MGVGDIIKTLELIQVSLNLALKNRVYDQRLIQPPRRMPRSLTEKGAQDWRMIEKRGHPSIVLAQGSKNQL